MAVRVYGRKLVNGAAARHVETQNRLRKEARQLEGRAKQNLARARASTRWTKIYGPAHLTRITTTSGVGEYGHLDYLVHLEAPNPMAIEFGHGPSGVFGPTGELGHIETKAPMGLYILTRAAYGAGSNVVPSASRNRGDGGAYRGRDRKRRR
jgi:hypothetical protein